MASRARPVRAGAAALAKVVALGVAGLTLGPTALLLAHGGGLAPWKLAPADLAALRFTLLQAALSALVSALLAVPLARALARRTFPGRGLLLTLMGAPFLLPVVVAVIGLLTVFGRSGWINAVFTALHLPVFTIYGLQGVVLAHVFLNLPLAVRMLLTGWQAIPAERFRLAETLGLTPRGMLRHLELPMLRETLPGVLVTVFLICLTSFVVALTLGGGPRATTLELAIYQALRFDFDPGHAASLALLQFSLCAAGVALAALLARFAALGAGLGRLAHIPAPGGWRKAADAGLIALALAFVTLPLAAILLDGVPGLLTMPDQVWRAAGLSLAMALVSAAVSVLAALSLALAVAARANGVQVWGARGMELAAMLPLAASGLVVGTGLFVLLRPLVAPEDVAVPVTMLTNAALALPFGFRLLLPQARQIEADYGRLAAALGLTGRARLRWLDLPRLARPLGLASGLAAALAMGDLGVIALFAGETATLPLVIQRLMGAYRMEEAASASVLLVALGFGLYALFDLWGRRHAAA
jgi:thiamine transport system permease protein